MFKSYRLFIIFILFSSLIYAQNESRVLRFPTINGNQIVFTYAGDLYTVSSTGGVARKITNHVGNEVFARFSPDGKQLAFTGQYDGNTEVYSMPSEGGQPKRLTFTATLDRDDLSDRMGPNNIVMGWKHDNKSIVFRSRMTSFNDFKGKLYLVSQDAELPKELPLPCGGFCSFSPDDKKMAYNRIFREFRTWKRYRGGMADDIWIYDFETKKIENITNNPALDIIPMWSGDNIYFISDRDENKRMNLYVYNVIKKDTRKLTEFKDFDIKFPSLGDKAIVFENGGFIYRFDLSTEKYEKVPILINDDAIGGRSEIKDVSKNINEYGISPDGKRVFFGARGDIFTVPAKSGITRNLTTSPGVHDRNAEWSPDGKWIAYISDASGEDEIYIIKEDGSETPKQLTTNSDTYKYHLEWSPDSKKILWADKKLRLRYVDIETKEITEAAKASAFEFSDYTWAPDGKWIAYTKPEEEGMNKIYIYNLDKKTSTEVTDSWYASSQPCFSSDGKYLFFVSNRDFNPTYSQTEFNHIYQYMSKIYLITLAKVTESPFKPKNDEVSLKDEKSKSEKSDKNDKKGEADKKEKKEEITVNVDLDGIKDRIIVLPIQAANYYRLGSVGEKIYYIRNASKDTKPVFLTYDLGKQLETDLGSIGNYVISADNKKMLVAAEGAYSVIDLPQAKVEIKDKINLTGLEVKLDKHQEWMQIFNECWRQMRDFFYAPNMHGVDWVGIRKKYEALVPYVSNRIDLTYIIGEVIGELSSGHTYVGGGEYPQAKRIQTGLLGARLERDAKSKYYKIEKILKGQNWDNSLRSPLTEVGVDVKEGDFILAVNGKSTIDMSNIYESLINTAGKQVKLTINSEPNEKGSRNVIVIPTNEEAGLYYFNWVQENIKKVNEATNGKVGYLHIPDMSAQGLNEFVKYYYPQLTKKALIIDVRGNGGGNVSPMIIERLRRELAWIDFARNTSPSNDPGGFIDGPKVCLLDEYSASDGDLFPARFKKYQIGKLIGKRSWGGVVGIRGTLPLLDGGYLNKPEFSRYSDDGQWIIEGHGVDPDIYVDNDPAKEYIGVDDQLNKAIEVIIDELKTKEKTIPPIPPYPDKSK